MAESSEIPLYMSGEVFLLEYLPLVDLALESYSRIVNFVNIQRQLTVYSDSDSSCDLNTDFDCDTEFECCYDEHYDSDDTLDQSGLESEVDSNSLLLWYMYVGRIIWFVLLLAVSHCWGFVSIFTVMCDETKSFFEWVTARNFERFRLVDTYILPVCWFVFTCNVGVIDVEIYPYMAGEMARTGRPYDEPYGGMCATRCLNFAIKCTVFRIIRRLSVNTCPEILKSWNFKWFDRVLFFPSVLAPFPYFAPFILVWIIVHLFYCLYCILVTILHTSITPLKNQSGTEDVVFKTGDVELRMCVPSERWDRRHDAVVCYNLRKHLGRYIKNQYATELNIHVIVSTGRSQVVIQVTMDEEINKDAIVEAYVLDFNNYLSGVYATSFNTPYLDVFWEWFVYSDQSGRESKKLKKKEKTQRFTKKEKKEAVHTLDELPDYIDLRRSVLNMEKFVVDTALLETMTDVCVRKKFLKVSRFIENAAAARNRIDLRLGLPTFNQAGDESIRFSIDDIFGGDNHFTRAISMCINMNRKDMSTGESAKLLLQISLWSYEIITAESLMAFIRKLTLLCTYAFPDVCSQMLEALVSQLTPSMSDQFGIDTFASWSKELNKMWKSSDSNIVGQLKKITMVLAAGAVFGANLENFSALAIMTSILQPSQAEIDKLKPTDIIAYFLECLTYFTQAAADAWRYGDLMSFFRLRDPAVLVSEEMVEIMDKYNRLHTYGLSMLDISVEELRQRCVTLKEDLKSCQGHPKLGGLIPVRTMFYNLDKIIGECDAGFKQKPLNETPFAMCAFGAPETGKSGVMAKAWQSIATNNGYDCGPRSTCHVNPSDKFQSTADGQYHVHLDDINQALGTKADSVNNSMLLLRMINQEPWYTNQAELGKKGTNVLNPKVVTITSQTQHMYTHEDVHEPAAIARRVALFVHVAIKPQFSTPGGSIDHASLDGHSDIHELTVTRPVAVGLSSDGKQIIRYQYVEFDFDDGIGPIALVKVSLKQFCYAAVHLYEKHMTRESEQLERIITVDACIHKMPRECCCKCEENQGESYEHLEEQKTLIGQFAPWVEPVGRKKKTNIRFDDEAAHAANLAEDDMEDNAGFDLEYLYSLALLVPHYLWGLPRLEVYQGSWMKPKNWYGNFIHSERLERLLGTTGKILVPSFVCSMSTLGPLLMLASHFSFMWIFPALSFSALCVPFVSYDMFFAKIKDWKIHQLMKFESKFRYLLWLKNKKNQVIAGTIVILTSVVTFIAYNLWNKKNEELVDNGGEFSDLTSKFATRKPEEWERDVHISPYIGNSRNITREQLIGSPTVPGLILKRNAYCVSDAKKSTNAFPLCGNYWLLPLHYVEAAVGRLNFYFAGSAKNGAKFSWTPGKEGLMWMRIPNHDVALCFIPDMPPQKDLRPLFVNKWDMPATGMLLYKNLTKPENEIAYHTIPIVFKGRGMSVSSENRKVVYNSVSYNLIGAETRGGMCMSPVIGDQHHPTILGLHTKGGGIKGVADILTLQEINTALELLIRSPLTMKPVCSDEMRLVGGLGSEVHPKHVGRFVEETEGISFLGSANNITRRKPKMHTQRTPVYDDVMNQFGIENDVWQAPPVNPPWLAHHKMLNNLREPATPDPALVARACEDYKKQLNDHFDIHPESLQELRKMTLDETLKGIPGVPGYESLNMSTSKGHVGVLFEGYKNGGRKSEVLEVKYENEDGTKCFEVICPDKLLLELVDLEDQAARLQRIGCVAALNFKDETLKNTKECARLFSALPLHFILLQRKYFLSFTKWFRDWNFVTECAVGINAHSPLWNTFAQYMKKYPNNVAGDYKAFDQKSIALFLLCCYNIIMDIYERAGYSERDLNIMSSLVMDLIYPIFDFNSDLVMSNGGNPSGHSLTVIINSIMNSLYMRYVFFKVLPELVRFQTWVLLLTYGDDNIMSIHSNIMTKFNQNVISVILGSIGIIYTDAHKSLTFSDFVEFDKMTFLKRSFVYREEFGGYVGPIEFDSIVKSLLYHIPSKAEGVLPQHQISQTLVSAADEAFLYGQEKFEELHCKLINICRNYGVEHIVVSRFFSGYEERLQDWKEKYEDQCFTLSDQSGYEVSHGVRVRASSIHPGFLNQRWRLFIGYLLILLASLLPTMCMALKDCKIMQLGKYVDPQHLSETKWITEMNMKTGSTDQIQTMHFGDGIDATIVSYTNMTSNETNATSTGDMQLKDFFQRPVLAATISWTPDLAGFGTTIDPWTSFFGNKRVINRINNFGLLSANLHVKFVINGNGFYYGRAIADYMPLYDYDDASPYILSSKLTLISASQRLHLQIDPTTSTGGEMVLPFIWFKDKLSIPLAEWDQMGNLYIREMNLLKHANAATTPLEINVYVWATEVELSMPTSSNSSALINQSGDEYGMDKFMNTATALEGFASTAASAMGMGGYVQASKMALSAASALAGLSRPPDNDSKPMRKKVVTNLTNVDASDGSTKLAVDSKQELSIGSEALNLSLPDEMNISTICSKQSFLCQSYWDLTQAVGDPIFFARCSPSIFATEAVPVNCYAPPMTYAALPFKFWRGKMKFRFQVVCSSFHRGRLLFTWNPTAVPSNESNVVLSAILDLGKSRELVFEVPWGSTQSFLNTRPISLSNTGFVCNPANIGVVPGCSLSSDNGFLSVFVLNTLAVPNTAATALVGINVFVSMDDAEFAVPDDSLISEIEIVNQSGDETDVPMPINTQVTDEPETTPPINTLALMYMGERIVNFRALLKRYTYHMSSVIPGVAATNRALYSTTFSAFPYYQGVKAAGIYAGTNKCRTSFINFLTPCYLAYRGGIRLKLAYMSNDPKAGPQYMSARRTRNIAYTNSCSSLTTSPTEEQVNAEATFAYAGHGIEYTNPLLQSTIEIEVPFQRNVRFAAAKNLSNYTTYSPVLDSVKLDIVGPSTGLTDIKHVAHHIAAAEDFSLLLWQGTPVFKVVTLP